MSFRAPSRAAGEDREKVIIASQNRHKIEEIRSILWNLGFSAVGRDEAGIPPFEVEETGTTFEENSFLKADAIVKASGMPAIADDSGLMVDALGGAPGVMSARFAGEHGDTDANNEKLLAMMEGLSEENRAAKFVCVITLLFPDGRRIVARGECPGKILTAPRGVNGFGYDPLFVPDGYDVTFAEMDPEEKNKISHRARALATLKEILEPGGDGTGGGRMSAWPRKGGADSEVPDKSDAGDTDGAGKKKPNRAIRMFYLGLKQYQDPYYQGVAATVAFFFILSIVPTLFLLSELLGIFGLSLADIVQKYDVDFSQDVLQILTFIVNTKYPTATTNILFIIMGVWAASRLQFTLMRVQTYTFSGGKDAGNYFQDRLRSLVTIIITVVMMVLTIIFMTYGEVVFRYIAEQTKTNEIFDLIWSGFRWPIAGVLYLLIVTFNYFVMAPRNSNKFVDFMPGGAFTAAGMLVVTMVYSAYSANAVGNSFIYGSMASIAVLMFWFYFISWVLILGILFNKVWDDTKDPEAGKDANVEEIKKMFKLR